MPGGIDVDRLQKSVDLGMLGARCPRCHRNLRMAFQPSAEHHQLLGNILCDGGPVVLTDQGESQVDSGSRTRRGPHVAVADVHRFAVDDHRRMAHGERVQVTPMRRRAPTVEHPGRGESE